MNLREVIEARIKDLHGERDSYVKAIAMINGRIDEATLLLDKIPTVDKQPPRTLADMIEGSRKHKLTIREAILAYLEVKGSDTLRGIVTNVSKMPSLDTTAADKDNAIAKTIYILRDARLVRKVNGKWQLRK